MNGIAAARRGAWLAAAFGLVGCAEAELGAHFVKSVARRADPPPAAAPIAPPPAAATPAFEASGVATWDGRGTIEGIWFAHPLATRAQRVRVRSEATGREVEGALFRRDPSQPGPQVIVSSDAARALGLTPDEPTRLDFVSLETAPAAAAAADSDARLPPPAPVEVAAAPVVAPAPPSAAGAISAARPAPVAPPPVAEAEATRVAALGEGDAPPARPATGPAPAPRPSAAPATEGGAYLRVGSFGDAGNAAALAERLRARGAPASSAPAGDLHIVSIGPLADAAAIEAARGAAAAEGLSDAYLVNR